MNERSTTNDKKEPTVMDLAEVLFTGYVRYTYTPGGLRIGELDKKRINLWWKEMRDEERQKFINSTTEVLDYLDKKKLLRKTK